MRLPGPPVTSIVKMPNSKTWMVAPLAYPETQEFHATFEDCGKAAANVHCETITEAVRPVFTDLPAVLKYSDVSLVPFANLSQIAGIVVAKN